MRTILCLFLIFSFAGSRASAQEFKFLHYQLADGLPSNTVYKVYKDYHDLLWFATDKGIASYNGKTFTRYNTFSGLPDNEIFFFQQDLQGRLWMGSFSGELSFIQDNVIHNSSNTPFLKLPFKGTVSCCRIGKDSSVTFLFENQKFVNIRNDKVSIYKLRAQNVSAYCIEKISDAEYKVFYVDKILTIDTSGRVLKEKKLTRKYLGYTLTEGASLSKVYLLGKDGVFDQNERLVYECRQSENSLYFPRSFEKNGNFFLSTRKGLVLNNQLLFPGMPVSSVMDDRSGNYWISTLNNGVYCLPRNFRDISEYDLHVNGAVNNVKEVHGKTLLATTLGSLYEFDKANGAAKYIGGGLNSQGLISNSELDKNGNYYVFSNVGDGDFIISGGIRKKIGLPYFDTITPKRVIAAEEMVYAFIVNEIYCFNNKLVSANNSGSAFFLKQKERIFYAASDDRNVWFSTSGGLYKIQHNKSIFQGQLPHINFRNFIFCSNYLIGYNERNDIFICNNYRGTPSVAKINKANYILEKIYLIDSTEAIISTSEHYLYIKLKRSDRQPEYEIKTIENSFIPKHVDYIHADREFLYFFKSDKVTKVARQILYQEDPKPSIYFSGLKAGSHSIPINPVVEIPYDQARNINIKFNSISDYGNELQYEYLIMNKSKSWTVSESPELNIVSPDYGEYIIKIRCKTISGQYSDAAAFKLIIDKPYWARWWFRILIFVLALLSAAGIMSIILKRIIRKQKKQRDIEIKHNQLESKALNALMNPHFIFNSLNNIQSLINDNNKELANKYLVVFSKVIRQNMLNLDHVTISLKDEVVLVENYLQLEKLRFEHAFNHTILIKPSLNIDEVQIPPLIIQPLVENAVKHGLLKSNKDKKELAIEISEHAEGLIITVRDNGIGLLQGNAGRSKEHTSLGIKNIMDRLEYFKAYNKKTITLNIVELYDEQGVVSGTLATLKIFN